LDPRRFLSPCRKTYSRIGDTAGSLPLRKGDRRPGCLLLRRRTNRLWLLVDLRAGLDEFKSSRTGPGSSWWASLPSCASTAAAPCSPIAAHSSEDPPFLSTIPDAICLLDYDVDQPSLERTIRVLKMRGSAHSAEKRRLIIEQGGLRLERVSD
jgi:hypothetical protein